MLENCQYVQLVQQYYYLYLPWVCSEDDYLDYRYRKDEIFKRMKITTFVQLVCQVYQIDQDEGFQFEPSTPLPPTDGEVAQAYGESPVPSLNLEDGNSGAPSIPASSRSTLLSVARGKGELDVHESETERGPDHTLPYLLLDVREEDDYSMGHIISAKNYPKSYLSRATNYETKDMLMYKNKPGKIIIVYDDDERVAPQAAQTLVQRGYDNLFMLSGGVKVAYKVFPEGLLTGSAPPTVSGIHACQEVAATQKQFEDEDIDKLEIYLDNHLQDSIAGSRLSKMSTASSRVSSSSLTSRSASSTSSVFKDRPAFR